MYPKVKCQVCGIDGISLDRNDKAGYFEGDVYFGPAAADSTISEARVKEYKVYVVDSLRQRLGDAVATVPRAMGRPADCCMKDAYVAHVATVLPRDFHTFMVVPVTVDDVELPVGTTSDEIIDRGTDGPYMLEDRPLVDFSLALTFSETVQGGSGSLKVRLGNADRVSIPCRSGIDYLTNHAVVPVRNNLDSQRTYSITVPDECFVGEDGKMIKPVPVMHDHQFKTIRLGTDISTYDVQGPAGLGPAFLRPEAGAWVTGNESFVIYFDEAVEKGPTPVHILQRSALGGKATVYDTHVGVALDDLMPGKVTLTPSVPLLPGYEYEVTFAPGAFKDRAGNYASDSRTSLGLQHGYRVRVPSHGLEPLGFVRHPLPGASRGVSRHTALVLEFAADVQAGFGHVELCSAWSQTDVCAVRESIPPSRRFFLGNKVLLKPEALLPGLQYNVSIAGTAIRHFPGIKANNSGFWPYSFTVDVPRVIDTAAPILVAGVADCNGDGDLEDTCDTDGDSLGDFAEQADAMGPEVPLPTSTKLRLHFQEAIEAVPGKNATLQADEEGTSSAVEMSVDNTTGDCVVVLSPQLLPGRLYTVIVPPRVLQDKAFVPNFYEGTSFSFYTPHETPTVQLAAPGLVDVSKDTVIRILFSSPTRLGFHMDKYVTIKDATDGKDQRHWAHDPDRLVFRANEVLIIPYPPLLAGRSYTVTLPKHAVRYMTQDYTFSFLTRVEDKAKPEVVFTYPRGMVSVMDLQAAPPYVLFSEGVQANATKRIHLLEDGVLRFAIAAADDACGTRGREDDACAVLDLARRKLQLYPMGLGPTGVGAASWANLDKTYTVELEAGAFTDALTNGETMANPADRVSFTFFTSNETVEQVEPTILDNETNSTNSSPSTPIGSAIAVDGATAVGDRPSNRSAEVEGEQDVVPPEVDYFRTTSTPFGLVVIVFSEAVRFANTTEVPIVEMTGNSTAVHGASAEIAGNEVTIRMRWEPGTSYSLEQVPSAFQDNAGNLGQATLLALPPFTISPDVTGPNATLLPSHGPGGAKDLHEAFVLHFDETVSARSGMVSISQHSSVLGCEGECAPRVTSLFEADVHSLTMMSVASPGGTGRSVVHIDPGKVLLPGISYSLHIPERAFMDAVGHTNEAITITVPTSLQKDNTPPRVVFADFGGDLPNPTLALDSSFVLYFTEAVQILPSYAAGVRLLPSTGGRRCSGGGECEPGRTCDEECGYEAASESVDIPDAQLNASGSHVLVSGLRPLEPGRGYKVVLDAGKFADLAGNEMAAVDGEQGEVAIVFQTGSMVKNDTVGPSLLVTKPANGAGLVPQTTTVQLTFDEDVMAGSGHLELVPEPQGPPGGREDRVLIPTRSCYFAGRRMTCKPHGNLKRATTYSIRYPTEAVVDLAGNPATSALIYSVNESVTFTTIDADLVAPVLQHVLCGSGILAPLEEANSTMPYVPQNAVLTLSFSETVQAGAGHVVLSHGTAGAAPMRMDVQAASSLIFDGSSVHIVTEGLEAGGVYTLSFDGPAVFQDAVGLPADIPMQDVTFRVLSSDDWPPLVFQQVPFNVTSSPQLAVNANITLFFSEAVQATGSEVVIMDGEKTIAIPLNNSAPLQGAVEIHGAIVTIDPWEDLDYNSTVSVHIANGTFSDMAGKAFEGFGSGAYEFRTPEYEFVQLHRHNRWAVTQPPPREGPVLQWINSTFLLFGGKAGSRCYQDSWTSTTGSQWTQVLGVKSLSHSRPVPKVANAPTAVDRWGCLWLLGGDCNDDPGTIWKTCTIGASWAPLSAPTVVPFGVEVPPLFPRMWMGHALAILGGWQLVIVDATDARSGAVWRFVDADARHVRRVAVSPLPFGVRRDPHLLAASDGTLYLLGGHRCEGGSLCSDVFTDVWASVNGGETWACQTTSFSPSLWSPHSRGIGRFSSAVIAHDDTIFLLGGHRPNSTEGLNEVYSSYAGPLDRDFPGGLYLFTPSEAMVSGEVNFTMYFSEGIGADAKSVRLLDYGAENEHSEPIEVSASVAVSRQMLTLTPAKALTPGHRYRVHVPEGSVKDLAGNVFVGGQLMEEVAADPDRTPPVVHAMLPQNGSTGVPPWSTLTFNMTEPVMRGSGSVLLAAEEWGHFVALDIEEAAIHHNMVFFQLPFDVRLTAGQTYHVTIPSGLLEDKAGNPIEACRVGSFKVLSGFHPSFNYVNFDTDDDVLKASDAAPRLPEDARVGIWHNVTLELEWQDDNETSIMALLNATQLELIATYPPAGATDVPPVKGVSVLMFFSRPVVFNNTGHILFRNGSGAVVGALDMHRNGSGNTSHVQTLPVVNGARILIPWTGNGSVLERGAHVSVHIPRGMIQDLDGNELDNISMSFTCLAEEVDYEAPVVTAHSPANHEKVPGITTDLDVYFSKEMEPGVFASRFSQFFIKIRHLSGGSPDILLIAGGAPGPFGVASLAGARLSVSLAEGALAAGGDYSLEIPSGAVRSKLRILPGRKVMESAGIEYPGVTVTFSTERDSDSPTLDISAQLPPHEELLTFTVSTSASILLTFNELVEAGEGAVILVPRHARENVSIPASSTVIAGSKVFVSPPDDLLPGEVYSVIVDGSAFQDLQKNPFQGLTHGDYMFSTAPRMRFRQVGRGQWNDTEAGIVGHRFASGVAVDPTNNILLVGGRNGTAGAVADAVLNDIWKFETLQEVKCASSFREPTDCTAQECSSDGMGGYMMGRTTFSETVWKRRSVGGASCVKPEGVRMSTVDQMVKDRDEVCPCPTCTAPPGAPPGPRLPAHMPNASYVHSYVLVSAANGTRPLLCRRGRTPTGPFMCVARNRYFGGFVTPYPTCESTVCSVPPNTKAVFHFASFNATGSTDGLDCAHLSSLSPMRHGGSCAFTCKSGWDPVGSFFCFEGVFRPPRCAPQTCNGTTIPHGMVDCAAAGGAWMDSRCLVVCNPGYEPVDAYITCAMHGSGSQASPGFMPAPVCRRSLCGEYPFTAGASVVYPPNSAKAMGDTAQVTCDSQHLANGRYFDLRCGPKQGAVWDTGVEWQLLETGARAGLLCARAGTAVQERVVMQGRLTLDFVPPAGATLRGACGNQDFLKNVAVSIAVSLASISQRTVQVSDVHDLELSACGQSRRLQAETTVLLYKLVVPGEAVAALFTSLLATPSIKGSFERTLTEAIHVSTGWTAQRVNAQPLGVDLVYGTELPTEPPGTTTTRGSSTSGSNSDGVVAEVAEDDDSTVLLAAVLGGSGGFICLILCCTAYFWVQRRRRYSTDIDPSVYDSEDPDSLALEYPRPGAKYGSDTTGDTLGSYPLMDSVR